MKRSLDGDDVPSESQPLESRFAGRAPVGSSVAVGSMIGKQCLLTKRFRGGKMEETLAIGAACSEVFSGPRLAKILRPAVEYQLRALTALEEDALVNPLSIHTSVALPPALTPFLDALSKHLPWRNACDDWFVNLQIEGTTAVWAGVETLARLRQVDHGGEALRDLVAVAERSYHGPKTTALGSPAARRYPGAPRTAGQVPYPMPLEGEALEKFTERFDAFLDAYGHDVSVIIFEPQWGSSNLGRVWPKELLQEAMRRSRERGIYLLCDEIMCGLGRHGLGTLFMSDAWHLDPDAVTFGKALSGGAYPMSGVVMKRGAKVLSEAGVQLVQSHTYAGSSELALMTARMVLNEVPKWFNHAAGMGQLVSEILGPFSDGKFVRLHGHGLMWGGEFVISDKKRRSDAARLFKKACEEEKVWPYFVGTAGFMLSPPMDVDEKSFREGLERLARSLDCARTHYAKMS